MAKFRQVGQIELMAAQLGANFERLFGEKPSKELILRIIDINIEGRKRAFLDAHLADSDLDLKELEFLKEYFSGKGN